MTPQRVLAAELGSGWRGRLGAFEELPFAAASIGQVHRAALPDGTPLAIKVQVSPFLGSNPPVLGFLGFFGPPKIL